MTKKKGAKMNIFDEDFLGKLDKLVELAGELKNASKQEPKLLVLNELMWSDSIGRDLTFDEAKEYAKKCRDGGYSDWRVPTAKELADTIDWEKGTSVVAGGAFGFYWSSSQIDGGANGRYLGANGRYLYFDSGYSTMGTYTKVNGFSVRCVRDLDGKEQR